MRVMVHSDEGGKPFELFTSEDNQLGEPGWYYTLMQAHPDGGWEVLDLEGPTGPFETINDAFADAIMCNY